MNYLTQFIFLHPPNSFLCFLIKIDNSRVKLVALQNSYLNVGRYLEKKLSDGHHTT